MLSSLFNITVMEKMSMKKVVLFVCGFGLISLVLLSMWRGIGGTYEFSPNTLQVRYVKTLYVRLLNIPLIHWVDFQRDYMLYPLWEQRGLVQRDTHVTPIWTLSSQWYPGGRHHDGPASGLTDIKTVAPIGYWISFTKMYPDEADALFRQVIAALDKNDIEAATTLLMTNAWKSEVEY